VLHALIVIPYYFVGTLAALPFLIVLTRILRLKVAINLLVATSIILSLAGLIVPLACDWVELVSLTGRPLLVLIVLSFLFAGVDAALCRILPLPLDAELREL